MQAPYNALDVANYIVWQAAECGNPVTHLKLQKLLYYVVAKYAQKFNNYLINEHIVKWQYGPVVKSVYHYFKIYGDRIIDKPIAYLTSAEIGNLQFVNVEAKNTQLAEDDKLVETVNEVLATIGSATSYILVERTHQESAWKNFEPQILQANQDLPYLMSELKAANI